MKPLVGCGNFCPNKNEQPSTPTRSKLWNYCSILRDDGLSYGDYVEQLTFLLFLKMADEQAKPPFNRASPIPKGFGWEVLVKLDGDGLETHYRHTLEELDKRTGMLGVIFRKAQNKIQDPAKLRRLIVDLINKGAMVFAVRRRERRREPILHAASAHCRDGGCRRPAIGLSPALASSLASCHH